MFKYLLSLLPVGQRLRGAMSTALVLALSSTAAQAQSTIYGLGIATRDVSGALIAGGAPAGTQGLAPLDATTGFPQGGNYLAVRITGVTSGQLLVGIDYRPSTGEMYALGYNASNPTGPSNAQLYTVQPLTGAATSVGSAITLALGGPAERIGFDFDPVADRIRVVSTNDTNYRLNPITGAVVQQDGTLVYPVGDTNAGKDPRVGAVAYTNSLGSPTTTTLYSADVRPETRTARGILATLPDPNSGVMETVPGSAIGLQDPDIPTTFYNIEPAAVINVDIYFDGTTNKAYLSELTKPNANGSSSTNLYDLNLTTGQATNRRTVVPASIFIPFNIRDIAVAPAPTITSLVPAVATINGPAFTLTVNGTGFVNGASINGDFVAGSQVFFNGVARATTFVSATQLTVQILATDITTLGTKPVKVVNPTAPGGTSNESPFEVVPVCDAPTNLAVTNITDASATVTFTGSAPATGYTVTTVPASTTQTLPGTATSAELTGLNANTAYTVNIVSNCASSTTSSTVSTNFTTVPTPNPAPTISSLSPSSATAGDPAFTLTVNGTGFIAGSVVSFGGTARTTAFVSATQVTASIPALAIAMAGTVNVTVTNAAPGGGTSAPATFTVNEVPACDAPTNLTVSSITTSSATVTFTGSASATSYTVTTDPASTTQNLPATATSVNLTGLNASTTYTVRIVSSCAVNSPSSAATLSFTTATPAPAPTLVVTQGGTAIANGGSPSYSFGSQTTGTTQTAVFTLANTGTTPLTISSIAVTNGTAFGFQTFSVPTTVPANGSTSLTVTYTVGTGAQSGSITILSDATNGSNSTFELTLNGTGSPAPAPEINVAQAGTTYASSSTFAFPATSVGASSSRTFTIQNTGTAPLLISSIVSSGDFTNDRNTTPFAVAGSSTATVTVTFTPGGLGARTGTLVINNNDSDEPTYTINLSGQGQTSTLTWNGNESTAWGTANNWTPNQVPTSSADVLIPSGRPNQPTVSDAREVRAVTLSSGAVLTLAATGTLSAYGNFINNSGTSATACSGLAGTGTFALSYSAALSGPQPLTIGGTALSCFPNLTVLGNAAATTGAVAVRSRLELNQSLAIGAGQPFTLLSDNSGTAYVVNVGAATLNGTATVQRYIAPNLNAGLGYRHYSSPVNSTTFEDLAAAGFTPVINPVYNTQGNTARPFPNVFGYDETRVNTSGSSAMDFDKGFFSPATSGSTLEITRGYTVNIAPSAKVDFVGVVNNGPQTATNLTRGNQPKSGWHLRGNPYPSALDWNEVGKTGLEGGLYVFKSSGQYSGSYATYNNGMGTNGGTNVVPVAQGFFVRTAVGQTGSLAFANADRITTGADAPFQRGTADTRPQLRLALGNAKASTQAVVYFERGATAGFDNAFDAHALPASTGLALATETDALEALAINGQPQLAGTEVLLPLRLAVPAAGTYVLGVETLANLPTPYRAYLRDALTGSYTDLSTTPAVSLNLTANANSGRYALLFSPKGRVLATAPAALAQLASVYPNPAHGTATLLLPTKLRGNAATAVTIVDNVGRVVLARTFAAGPAETLELPLNTLSAGVYTVLARTAAGLVAKRLVVE